MMQTKNDKTWGGAVDDRFSEHIEAVARVLMGEPNKGLSKPNDLRFGTHGSMSINPKDGTAYDFEMEKGGGVLWLIEQQTGRKGAGAFQWLKDNGFPIEDRTDEASRTDATRKERTRSVVSRVAARVRNDIAPVLQAHRPAPEMPGRHEGPPPPSASDNDPARAPKVICSYDYVDEQGILLFQVQRLEGLDADGKRVKTFRQRFPDPNERGGWNYKVRGNVRIVPYRMPEVIEAIAAGRTIFLVEGEKDADNLWKLGVPATCNPGGAGKWQEELTPHFRGADLVCLPDNDPQKKRREKDGTYTPLFHDSGKPILAGQDHMKHVGTLLSMVARVKVLELARFVSLPPKGDVSDWIEAGGTADMLYALIPAALDVALFDPAEWFLSQNYKPHFKIETWADLGKPGKTHEWVVKNLLSRNEMSMLAGASQAGKSFLTIDLAMAICRGVPFLGHKVVRPGGVIYQAGEGYAGLRDLRIPAYMIKNGLTYDDNLPFGLLGSAINLWSGDADCDRLIEDVMWRAKSFAVPLELIIIDTLASAIAGANENASDDIGRTLSRANRIREATGASVLLVHHLNASGEKARGHTSLGANVETVLTARLIDGMVDKAGRKIREVEITKQKDGAIPKPLRFVLRAVTVRKDEDGDDVTSCIVEEPDAVGRGRSSLSETTHPNAPSRESPPLEAYKDVGF